MKKQKGGKKGEKPSTPKADKPVKVPKHKVISFGVTAVIPTQSYGNIQPHIVIEVGSIEDGRKVVMPVIEDLIRMYAETKPGFLGRVEVTEKVVTPAPAPKAEEKKEESPSSAQAPEAAPASSAPKEKTEAYNKAEKAISLAATVEALGLIEDQIQKSVKIDASFKPELYTLVLKKRKELQK